MKRTQIDEPQPTSGRDKRQSKNVCTKVRVQKFLILSHFVIFFFLIVHDFYVQPVSKEKNRQNGHGKRHSENSSMEVRFRTFYLILSYLFDVFI